MALPRIPQTNVRKVMAKDVRAVVARMENKPGAGHQNTVDKFLKPLLHSRLGRTPAYTRLKALLEYESSKGKEPEEFVREMVKQSKMVLKQHSHELSLVRDYVNALKRGNNIQRLKREVLMPAQTRAISLAEAWRRINSLVAAPSGQQSAALYDSRDASSQASQGSHGGSRGSHGGSQGSHGGSQGSHGGSQGSPPTGSPPTGSPPTGSPPTGSPPTGSPPTGSQSGSPASNGPSVWSTLNSLVAPSGHQNQTTTSSGIGGTIGIGGTGGGSCAVGGAVTLEILGARYHSPAFYTGLEVSVGAQAGVDADFVVEVGFCQPDNFGGWYVGIGVAGAFGIGAIIQVTWALPPLAPDYHPLKEIGHGFSLVPQGFSVGVGIGEEVEVAVVAGGGQVTFWDLKES